MNTLAAMRHVSILIIICSSLALTYGAEVQLRDVCHVTGTVVRLGEIADIYDEDQTVAERLAASELCPAPFAGQRRTLTHRQIRDHLSRAGWNLADHQFSGASHVVVHANQHIRLATAALSSGRPVSTVATRSAHQQVESLLLADLHKQFGKQKQQVKFRLTPAQSQLVRSSHGKLRLNHSLSAGSGSQRVEMTVAAKSMIISVEVDAPQAVVTTRRDVPRGKILTLDDVELAYSKDNVAKRSGATRVEDLLGQEATTRLTKGQVVQSRHARRRMLVRSGSVVTVYARNAGIQVRTTAVARENGARGDIIWVEALKKRKKYSARVVEIDTVEVLAQSATVRGSQ